MVGNVVGHFRILNRIGGGAMGTVYRAEDLKLKRTVALKFLPEEVQRNEQMKKRLIREAVAASSLDHPNICTIFEVDETEAGEVYFSMAFYEGETLAARIDRGDLATEEIVRIAEQIADALEHAHEKKLVHRDLKPSNIMLVNGGMVKILDFGLVQTLADNIETIGSESTSGTPAYMSPEQARAEVVDARTDIWSFGVLLYKMLTGSLPFRGNYSQAVIYSILHEEPDFDFLERSGADSGLQDIVKNCLKKEVRERITSFEQVSDKLKRLSDGMNSGAIGIDSAVAEPRAGYGTGEKGEDVEDSDLSASGFWNKRKWRILLPAGAAILLAVLIWSILSTGPVTIPPERRVVAVLPVEVQGAPLEKVNWLSEHLRLDLQASLYAIEIFNPGLILVPDRIVRKDSIHDLGSAQAAIGATHAIGIFCHMEESQLLFEISLHSADTLQPVAMTSFSLSPNEISISEDRIFSAVTALLNVNPDTMYRCRYCSLSPEAYRHYAQAMIFHRNAVSDSDMERAIMEFERARAFGSDYGGKIYGAMAIAYWRLYNITKDDEYSEKSHTYLRTAKSYSPDNPQLQCLNALHLLEQDENKKAEKIYREILKRNPLCTQAVKYYGHFLFNHGRLDEAKELYKKLVDLAPYHRIGYAKLGYAYFRENEFSKADSMYKQESRYSVGNSRAKNDRGAMLLFQEKWHEAFKCFKRSLEIEENADAYTHLGNLLFFWNPDYVKAGEYYKKSIEMEPDDYSYQGNLAISYYWRPEKKDESKQWFRSAIRQAKKLRQYEKNASVMADLALYSVFLGNKKQSLKYIEKALELNKSEKREVLMQAVSVYSENDNFELAYSFFTKALKKGEPILFYTADPMLEDFLKVPRVIKYLKDTEAARKKKKASSQTADNN